MPTHEQSASNSASISGSTRMALEVPQAYQENTPPVTPGEHERETLDEESASHEELLHDFAEVRPPSTSTLPCFSPPPQPELCGKFQQMEHLLAEAGANDRDFQPCPAMQRINAHIKAHDQRRFMRIDGNTFIPVSLYQQHQQQQDQTETKSEPNTISTSDAPAANVPRQPAGDPVTESAPGEHPFAETGQTSTTIDRQALKQYQLPEVHVDHARVAGITQADTESYGYTKNNATINYASEITISATCEQKDDPPTDSGTDSQASAKLDNQAYKKHKRNRHAFVFRISLRNMVSIGLFALLLCTGCAAAGVLFAARFEEKTSLPARKLLESPVTRHKRIADMKPPDSASKEPEQKKHCKDWRDDIREAMSPLFRTIDWCFRELKQLKWVQQKGRQKAQYHEEEQCGKEADAKVFLSNMRKQAHSLFESSAAEFRTALRAAS